MKKILLLFCCVLFFSCDKKDVFFSTTDATPEINFIKTFGGSKNDVAQAVIATTDNGYAVLGHTQSNDFDIDFKINDSFDFWLLKFDENHNLQWSKTFGGTNDDRGRDLLQTKDNGFLITGFTRSTDGNVSKTNGNYDFWTLKLDTNGTILWEKTFGFSGSDQAYTIKETVDGNFLLGGSLDVTASNGQGNSKTQQKHAGGDFWLIKINENGNKIWSRFYGGLFTDSLFDIEETDNGDFLLTGSSDSDDTDIKNNIGDYDFWIVKVDKNGDLIWEKSFGGTQADEAFSIVKTENNQFLVVGNSRSTDVNVSENLGSSDIWLIKIDADGNLIQENIFGGSSFEIANKIIQNSPNNYTIVGSSRSADFDVSTNNGNKDIWIININKNGKINWEKSIGGSNLDEANSVIYTKNNDLIIVGEAWSSDNEIPENKGFSDVIIINIK